MSLVLHNIPKLFVNMGPTVLVVKALNIISRVKIMVDGPYLKNLMYLKCKNFQQLASKLKIQMGTTQ